MAKDTLYERFRELLKEHDLKPEKAAVMMGASVDTVRRLMDGRTAQMKLDEALLLCDELGADPWELAFGRPRPAPGIAIILETGEEIMVRVETPGARTQVEEFGAEDFVFEVLRAHGNETNVEVSRVEKRNSGIVTVSMPPEGVYEISGSPQPAREDRLSKVEAELRETREILGRLEAAVLAGELAPKRPRKAKKLA